MPLGMIYFLKSFVSFLSNKHNPLKLRSAHCYLKEHTQLVAYQATIALQGTLVITEKGGGGNLDERNSTEAFMKLASI